jgi:hypothetical protein
MRIASGPVGVAGQVTPPTPGLGTHRCEFRSSRSGGGLAVEVDRDFSPRLFAFFIFQSSSSGRNKVSDPNAYSGINTYYSIKSRHIRWCPIVM